MLTCTLNSTYTEVFNNALKYISNTIYHDKLSQPNYRTMTAFDNRYIKIPVYHLQDCFWPCLITEFVDGLAQTKKLYNTIMPTCTKLYPFQDTNLDPRTAAIVTVTIY